MPFSGCIEEQLELHEVWVLKTNTAGLGRDILDVFAAEQTSREGPVVFVASSISPVCGKLVGHVTYYILSKGVTPDMAGCSLSVSFLCA